MQTPASTAGPRSADSRSGPRLFIRDDDVGELTPALRHFVELFAERALPVSYQIIPARLTEECAAFLIEARAAHPGLIEFGQHGLTHAMTVRGRALKREFGPERSLAEQTADIVRGRELLQALLGAGTPIDLFTPPQHKFDRNTLLAVRAAGHRVFSAASYPTAHHRAAYALGRGLGVSSFAHHGISHHGRTRPEAALAEVSIAIAVDDGKALGLAAEDLSDALAVAARHRDPVGLMFHHALYQGGAGEAALVAIAETLAGMGPQRFHPLTALATPI